MTKFAKTFSPIGVPPIPSLEMERLLIAEANRLAAILDVSPAAALRSLRNLIDKGLVEVNENH